MKNKTIVLFTALLVIISFTTCSKNRNVRSRTRRSHIILNINQYELNKLSSVRTMKNMYSEREILKYLRIRLLKYPYQRLSIVKIARHNKEFLKNQIGEIVLVESYVGSSLPYYYYYVTFKLPNEDRVLRMKLFASIKNNPDPGVIRGMQISPSGISVRSLTKDEVKQYIQYKYGVPENDIFGIKAIHDLYSPLEFGKWGWVVKLKNTISVTLESGAIESTSLLYIYNEVPISQTVSKDNYQIEEIYKNQDFVEAIPRLDPFNYTNVRKKRVVKPKKPYVRRVYNHQSEIINLYKKIK